MKGTMILLLGAAFAVGCGQHPVDEFQSTSNEVAEEICSCPEVVAGAGYDSEAACVVDNSVQFTEAELQCFRDAYDRNESAASPSVSCSIEVANDLKSCIEDASCNAAALQSCFDMFDFEDACPVIPDSAQAEFDACFM